MTFRPTLTGLVIVWLGLAAPAGAQDLGPRVKKLVDDVYVHLGKDFNSNAGIVLTTDGRIRRLGEPGQISDQHRSRLPHARAAVSRCDEQTVDCSQI